MLISLIIVFISLCISIHCIIHFEFLFLKRNITQFKNQPKIFTDTSSRKIYRWQISAQKDGLCHVIWVMQIKTKIPSQTYYNEKSRTLATPKAGKYVGQQEFSYIISRNEKMVKILWKTIWLFLGNLLLLQDLIVRLFGIYQRVSN